MRTEVDTFVWSSINLKRLNVDIQCGHLMLSISMLDSLTEVTPSRYAFQGMRTPARYQRKINPRSAQDARF